MNALLKIDKSELLEKHGRIRLGFPTCVRSLNLCDGTTLAGGIMVAAL
jgi:hypothetical protein